MAPLAFLLLVAALLVFLLSTKQWPLPQRGLIWGGAFLLLAISAFLTVSDPSHQGGLFQALEHPGNFFEALSQNGGSVAFYVLSLLDLFLILGLVLGIIALVAFTPGEALEQALRPWMLGLVGAVFGGALATALIGSGGIILDRSAAIVYLTPADVIAGDSIRIGGISEDQRGSRMPRIRIHLAGIDAPELGQTCRTGAAEPQECASEATRFLQGLVQRELTGVPFICSFRDGDVDGIPMVQCTANVAGRKLDLAERVVRAGYAIRYRDEAGDYADAAAAARGDNVGLMSRCTLRPEIWRGNEALRLSFTDRTAKPSADEAMGDCRDVTNRGPGGPRRLREEPVGPEKAPN